MIRHKDLKLKIAMGSSTTPTPTPLHISLHARTPANSVLKIRLLTSEPFGF